MQCLKCGLQSSIDCQVYLPGDTKCLRCGAEMTKEQKEEWHSYWALFTKKKKGLVASIFSR